MFGKNHRNNQRGCSETIILCVRTFRFVIRLKQTHCASTLAFPLCHARLGRLNGQHACDSLANRLQMENDSSCCGPFDFCTCNIHIGLCMFCVSCLGMWCGVFDVLAVRFDRQRQHRHCAFVCWSSNGIRFEWRVGADEWTMDFMKRKQRQQRTMFFYRKRAAAIYNCWSVRRVTITWPVDDSVTLPSPLLLGLGAPSSTLNGTHRVNGLQ